MMTSIDFGCYAIRSATRTQKDRDRINMVAERSEYCILAADADCRNALSSRRISHAECDDALVVFGNQAFQTRWLSRKPCAPLFADGRIPTSDAPARQIISVFTEAILANSDSAPNICCFTAPRGRGATDNMEFLSRLIRMHGFAPLHCTAATAATLASGHESGFTGVTIVLGAESCEVSVNRLGQEIAADFLDVGSNWIDTEIAQQFQMQTWDEQGNCYLDLESVREWKHDSRIHLRSAVKEREKMLARLYGEVLSRIAASVKRLLQNPAVESALAGEQFVVVCAGGPTQIGGFAGALTERLVEYDVAGRIRSINTVEDASLAVTRGLLIQAELEMRRADTQEIAA